MHPDANALWTCTTGGFALFDDADVLLLLPPIVDQRFAIDTTTEGFPRDSLWQPTSPCRAAAGDRPPIVMASAVGLMMI